MRRVKRYTTAMDPYLENLEEEVLLKNNTITYKWLVKNLKVPSNVAKQMLYEFVEKQKAANVLVNVTYLICGEHRAEDGLMVHEVYIVPESSLESVKSKLTVVTSVHIYAVNKIPLQDPGVLYSVDYELFNGPLEEKRGFYQISCPDLIFRHAKVVEQEVKPPIRSEIVRENLLSNNSTAETNKKKDNASTCSKQSNSAIKKLFNNINKKEKLPPKKSLSNTDKQEIKEEPKLTVEESEPEEKVKTSTITMSNTSKNKNGVSKKRSLQEDHVHSVTKDKSNVGKRRRIIEMSDSSDEESDTKMEDDADDKINPTSLPVADSEDPLIPPSPRTKDFHENLTNQENQVRHKRALVEEMTLDKDGYLVTQKVWKDVIENESVVKENQSVEVNKLEEKPLVKQKQSTLMSFFKKK